MHLLQLRSKVDEKSVKALLGKKPERSDFALLLTENGTVYKPNGERLLTLIRGGLTEESAKGAYPFLHRLRQYRTTNRGNYSGVPRSKKMKEDGTLSNTNVAAPVCSAIAGYFDRNPRYPYCRETSFVSSDPDSWAECRPMIQEVARLFEQHAPDRYASQAAVAKKTHPAYLIPETPFTTLTINNCVAAAYHLDAGDYKPGFGCISVLRRGQYEGCLLGFPAYGCAVDLQDRDVLLFDAHEVHGNTAFHGTVGEEGVEFERISVVFYFREKMIDCLSPAKELERVKKIRGGDFTFPTVEDG